MLLGQAEQVPRLSGSVENFAGQIRYDDGIRASFDQALKLITALAQCLFGSLPLLDFVPKLLVGRGQFVRSFFDFLFQYIVGLLQLRFSEHPFGDVGHHAFESFHFAVVGIDGDSLFPDPFLLAGCCADTVFHLEMPTFGNCRLHMVPNQLPVIRVDDVCIGDFFVPDKSLLLVACQQNAPFADELHRPICIVVAAVGHARQIRQERGKTAISFLLRRVGSSLLRVLSKWLLHGLHRRRSSARFGRLLDALPFGFLLIVHQRTP